MIAQKGIQIDDFLLYQKIENRNAKTFCRIIYPEKTLSLVSITVSLLLTFVR